MSQASFEPGTSRSRVLRSAVAPHWLGNISNVKAKKSNYRLKFDRHLPKQRVIDSEPSCEPTHENQASVIRPTCSLSLSILSIVFAVLVDPNENRPIGMLI